ncbi:MAG TPA: ATP-binding protein [Thermoanaerobaculia bacterium]|nr:ATP-binding protein [Thermoanaerobaculia bacterium]
MTEKGQSPFYPGQPVPVELFVGRAGEVERIRRAARQVAAGKPQAIFISGEYGIGKSSLARYVRFTAEREPGLLGFHVLLGTSHTLEEVAQATVRTVLEAASVRPKVAESLRNFLAEYIGEQTLFGVTLRLDKLKKDAPDLSRGYLPFLRSLYEKSRASYRGLILVLDEINGLSAEESFAFFLKDLVDSNALSEKPLPLLLILCGTEERRRQLIERHRPIERIFEVAHIDPLSEAESREFFARAFGSVQMEVTEDAMDILCRYSGGLPKLMHLLGDAAYWIAPGATVDADVAVQATWAAAEDVGRKFVDLQVYRALRSQDYRRILKKLARADFDLTFRKFDIAQGLSQEERKKLDNFLQRMKRLGVLAPGEERGEYTFCDRLTRLYLLMESAREE